MTQGSSPERSDSAARKVTRFFGAHATASNSQPSVGEVIREAARDFFLPYIEHRKAFIISSVVFMVIGAVTGYLLAPRYFDERNSLAQRADLVARNLAIEVGRDSGPFVTALKVHRRMVDECLEDLEKRVKASWLAQHKGQDYFAPLKAAQRILKTNLPYELNLKNEGEDIYDVYTLSRGEQMKAQTQAQKLMQMAAAEFLKASIQIDARSTRAISLPAMNGEQLRFNASNVTGLIDGFLERSAKCLSPQTTNVDELTTLVTDACMASRIAQGAVLFGLPEIASDQTVVSKIGLFRDQLYRLRQATDLMPEKYQLKPDDADRLKKYARSEDRRFQLVDQLIKSGYVLDYPELRRIYDDAERE